MVMVADADSEIEPKDDSEGGEHVVLNGNADNHDMLVHVYDDTGVLTIAAAAAVSTMATAVLTCATTVPTGTARGSMEDDEDMQDGG